MIDGTHFGSPLAADFHTVRAFEALSNGLHGISGAYNGVASALGGMKVR